MTIANLEQKRIEKFRANVSEFAQDLLEIGQIANPSNPYQYVAEMLETMSEWNKKDWECIFKRELTFQEIRSAQVTFKELSKTISEQIARWYK